MSFIYVNSAEWYYVLSLSQSNPHHLLVPTVRLQSSGCLLLPKQLHTNLECEMSIVAFNLSARESPTSPQSTRSYVIIQFLTFCCRCITFSIMIASKHLLPAATFFAR